MNNFLFVFSLNIVALVATWFALRSFIERDQLHRLYSFIEEYLRNGILNESLPAEDATFVMYLATTSIWTSICIQSAVPLFVMALFDNTTSFVQVVFIQAVLAIVPFMNFYYFY